MQIQNVLIHRDQVAQFQRKHRVGLVTLVFTDIVGSTQIKQQYGDREGIALIHRHHQLLRELLHCFPEAEEISTAGDSFFLVFARPSDAAKFALLLNARLRALAIETGKAVFDRVGIHVGEVLIEEIEGQNKPRDLYGIQVDLCSRLMSLGSANQILLTRFAFDNARQVLRGQDLEEVGKLDWVNHGLYLLKGVDEPVEICEVADIANGPPGPPTTSEKAQRFTSVDNELVLGWRPAIEQPVPGTKWVLEEKLGEGGFGEVWLARHQQLGSLRVFKFCFRADRVRSLRREVTLFRLLRERVGMHPNIVSIEEVYFDEPPFYVVMDYVPGKDLASWLRAQSEPVPVEQRLEVVAQVADALQAAHDAGIIHRDVKPSNILVGAASTAELHRATARLKTAALAAPADSLTNAAGAGPAPLVAKLTDFGIGQVVSEEYLAGHTRAGFTQTMLSSSNPSLTGTQLYMAPELLAGKPASTRSDIFSLGVVLYQLVIGDLARPLTTDWAEQVCDPLLREDLKKCFAGNPQDRFDSAGQLARNLRSLDQRRAAAAAERERQAEVERAAYRRGVLQSTLMGLVILLVVSGLAIYAFRQTARVGELAGLAFQQATRAERFGRVAGYEKRQAEKAAMELRRSLYVADMNLAWQAINEGNLGRAQALLSNYLPATTNALNLTGFRFAPSTNQPDLRGFEWRFLWNAAKGDEHITLGSFSGGFGGLAISPDGQYLASGDRGDLIIRQLASKQIVRVFTNGVGSPLKFSPDGQWLVAPTHDATRLPKDINVGLRRWSARTWEESALLPALDFPLVFSKSNAWMIVAEGNRFAVWDTKSWQRLYFLPGTGRADAWSRQALALSADERLLLWGTGPAIRLWDLEKREELEPLKPAFPDRTTCVSVNADNVLASAHWNGSVLLWDLNSRRQISQFAAHSGWVTTVTFSPDGSTLASCSADQTIVIYDVATRQIRRRLKGHQSEVWALAYSPDGEWLVSGSDYDGTLKMWKANEARAEELTGREWHPFAFSKDGSALFGFGNKTLERMDLRTRHVEPLPLP
ncbi:MAG: protein kinase, partial [Verrucomicrobiota bacterium]